MAKLHYFNQTSADADDIVIQLMKEMGHVPPDCLLGGIVARPMWANGNKPCDTCKGPRSRCGGTPELTDYELSRSYEEKRIERLFVGDTENLVDKIIMGGKLK